MYAYADRVAAAVPYGVAGKAVVSIQVETSAAGRRRSRADLVITDLIMPDQEGIETIQALRREAPGVPIVAISGAIQPEYLQMAGALGADATLGKPLSAEVLLQAVWTLLARQS